MYICAINLNTVNGYRGADSSTLACITKHPNSTNDQCVSMIVLTYIKTWKLILKNEHNL